MTTLFTTDHEWLRIEGDVATIGVTDYAQGELGDGRTLGDLDHHDVAFAVDLDLAEELGLVQGADGALGGIRGQAVALVDRQVVEHRARRDAA